MIVFPKLDDYCGMVPCVPHGCPGKANGTERLSGPWSAYGGGGVVNSRGGEMRMLSSSTLHPIFKRFWHVILVNNSWSLIPEVLSSVILWMFARRILAFQRRLWGVRKFNLNEIPLFHCAPEKIEEYKHSQVMEADTLLSAVQTEDGCTQTSQHNFYTALKTAIKLTEIKEVKVLCVCSQLKN